MALPRWRRVLSLAVLAVALIAAVITSRQETRLPLAQFLLVHVEARAGDVVLGRDRLVEVTVRVPDPVAGHARWTHTVAFAPGQAPEATDAVSMPRPPGIDHLEVSCKFALLAGVAPVRTAGQAPLPPHPGEAGRMTVDVGTCGEPER